MSADTYHISALLTALGAQPRHRGFIYLTAVLQVLMDNPHKLAKTRRDVYPSLCEDFDCTISSFEHGISFAINHAFTLGSSELLTSLFPLSANSKTPTNLEFITVVYYSLHNPLFLKNKVQIPYMM